MKGKANVLKTAVVNGADHKNGEKVFLQMGSEDPEIKSQSINDILVSWGNTVLNSAYVDGVMSLSEVFEAIRTGIFNEIRVDKKLDTLKKIEKKEDQKKYKEENLPYFVGATFTSSRRKRYKAISSQIMIFDYDHLDDEQVKTKREILVKDPHVLCLFSSPRG